MVSFSLFLTFRLNARKARVWSVVEAVDTSESLDSRRRRVRKCSSVYLSIYLFI